MRAIPRGFWLPATLALAMLILPLVGMASRVPWADLGPILSSAASTDALWLSLRTCLTSMAICLLVGTPLALIFARAAELPRRPAWLTPLRTFVLVPLVMPPVVAGLALLTTFGRRGLLGSALEVAGIQIPFTTAAVILAQVFVSLPFLVTTVDSAARAAGSDLEHAAAGLGASRWVQFRRITLPVLGPSIVSGAVLAFARSLGEFGATITFAGSLQGTTRTLPLEVYLQREQDPDSALALALLLILIALLVTALTTAIEAHSSRRFARTHDAEKPGGADMRGDGGGPAGVVGGRAGGGGAGGVVGADSEAEPETRAPVGFVLEADVPERGVRYRLEAKPGETIALIGPNGSGKSTGIRLLAGDITSPTSRAERPDAVGFLDQAPSLFPHMSVLDNVAFGPRCAGVAKAKARERARAELAAVGMAGLEQRNPRQLSGGQAQRVALARLLAVNPQLLLLDEPFAALDPAATAQLRAIVARRVAGITTLIVTHDIVDALTLADRVAVLEGGKLVALAPMPEALSRPATAFVASFAGVNMQFGVMGAEGLVSGGVTFQGIADGLAEGEPGAAVFEPTAVALRVERKPGSPRNVFEARVRSVSTAAVGVNVELDIGSAAPIHAVITAGAAAELGVEEGASVFAEVKAVQVRLITTSHVAD
ncbi:ABC transporter permease [Trueperella abortisuis]|uniref:ABC transporter permease n=1 Tax=Trueperella abortisuis TaxID=445930 RepID=UPI0028931531|nr:ABC transporter permease [Trueperella abortisuis]